MSTLIIILLCLFLAYIFSNLCRHLNIPRVIGQIAVGLLLGIPVIKTMMFDNTSLSMIESLAQIGVILLFFFIGLEIDMGIFKRDFKEASYISLFNTTLPLLLGFVVCNFLLGFSVTASLVIAISLSVSAQSVSIDFLEELRLLKTRIGNLIITGGAVDDIFELLLISIVFLFIEGTTSQYGFLKLIVELFIFTIIILIFKIYVIPMILHSAESEKSTATLFMGALIIVLLMAALAEFLHVGALVGALFAGLTVRRILLDGKDKKPWEEHLISNTIHIIAFGFLVPMFFIWIGLTTDVPSIIDNIWLAIIFFAIACVGTIGGTILGVMRAKGSFNEGLLIGIGLNPKGDVELVLAAFALQAGIISKGVFSALVLMAIATTLISPVLFRYIIMKEHILKKIKAGLKL
ncbi:cation:proton antiporter [Candidatus Woesearchaeota archaeon]|nr:cation:proton antiporter [Candidatus Woesearchaeota archaeon]